MTKAIIICHGQLAFDFCNTLKKLYGPVSEIYPFSNEFLAPEILFREVADTIRKNDSSPFVIMVDLRGGNCWKIGKMLTKEFQKVKLLSGVNIPMLVSFVNKKDRFDFEELVTIIEQDSHRGIVLE
ncbi:MAG: PTS sugar transporter subunit IIA [Calditrichia bacterium]